MSWWNSYEATNMFRLLFASFLSGLIGIEREVHGRAAGFRTHLLVGVMTCLMMIVSDFFRKYGGLNRRFPGDSRYTISYFLVKQLKLNDPPVFK